MTAPGEAAVQEVDDPVAAAGEVVVEVERAGICGTDVEFFTGEMAYLPEGKAWYPIQLGHEWCGVVSEVGAGVDGAWLGRRVTSDTMLGCGSCRLCGSGRQHLCADRQEIGIRGGRPGALAERLAVPAVALHALPDSVPAPVGAMVEPGANALRAAEAASGGEGPILVLGPGSIGLLTALFLRAMGLETHVAGVTEASVAFALGLGLEHVWMLDDLPRIGFEAVVDCTDDPTTPARALRLVEPGGRLVLIGLSVTPSLIDTRGLVFADLTTIGILSASPAIARVIDAYAEGLVDPEPLIGATVGLAATVDVLAGRVTASGPKILVDPRA